MQDISNRAFVRQASFTALIVEDDPDYALNVQKCLQSGMEPVPQIRHAETMKEALRELGAAAADIVLLDLNLPDSLGLDTVRALNGAAPGAAIIVMTATGGEDIARLMLRGGAQDFLTKDEINTRTLNRAVSYALERKRADNELRSSRSQVRHLQLSHDAILRATPAALASLRSDWSVVWANDSMKQLFEAVGRPGTSLRDLFASDASFANYTASARVRTSESLPDRREIELKLRENKSCVCELNLVRLNPDETAAGYLATLVDVTDRAVAEQQRESLIRLAQALSCVVTEAGLGEAVARECAQIFQHDAFWFSRYIAAENSIRHFRMEDTAEGAASPSAMPVPSTYEVLRTVPAFANGKPRLVNRASETPTNEDDHLHGEGQVQRRSRSLMFAPVLWQGEVLGVISVQSYHACRYTEADLELLCGFADQCGSTLARIRAQGELQRSERLYRGIVQDQSEAIIRMSPELVLTFCNRSFSRIVGAAATQLPGTSYLDHMSAADRKRLKLQLGLLRPDEPAIDIEHGLYCEEIEACRLIWTYRGIFDEQGNLQQYQAVGSDVTRLRIAESALARSEQRLELIVSQIPAFLYTTDDQLRFTSVLGRLSAIEVGMPGTELEQFIGKHVQEVLVTGPEEQDKIFEAHELSLHTGATTGYLFNRQDSYLHARVQPLRRSDGEIIGVVGIALDVTERLRSEEEQRRLQEELHAAEKLAVIGRAMASIGHCMKNMLTGLNGGMFLVDRCCDAADSVNPMLLQAQDLLRRSSSRISLLLLNMLDVSKDRQANFCPTNIAELLDEVVAILRTSSMADGTEIFCHVDAAAKSWFLDSDRLYRALLNLGLNSLDALNARGRLALLASVATPAEVGVLFRSVQECRQRESNLACRAITQLLQLPTEPMLRIDIADSGSGMDREIVDQLFEPFFSTKYSRGTGLGLSATLQFVEAHGGHILVQSERERGTTFTLLLPDKADERSQDGE